MMKFYILYLAHVSLLASVLCQTIEYLPHTDFSPIKSPLGGVYDYYALYRPSLKVVDGCVPFPAVGTYTASRGLRLGGAMNGLCSSSPGQVYARHRNFQKEQVRGIMYAYYFPKDQALDGIKAGHRHDWEEAVIWVSWDWKTLLGASLSAHGGYIAARGPQDGSHHNVHYFRTGTHAFGILPFVGSGFYDHPIANWYQLSEEIRFTLNNAVWLNRNGRQKATPKIIDSQFGHKMLEACEVFFKHKCE